MCVELLVMSDMQWFMVWWARDLFNICLLESWWPQLGMCGMCGWQPELETQSQGSTPLLAAPISRAKLVGLLARAVRVLYP